MPPRSSRSSNRQSVLRPLRPKPDLSDVEMLRRNRLGASAPGPLAGGVRPLSRPCGEFTPLPYPVVRPLFGFPSLEQFAHRENLPKPSSRYSVASFLLIDRCGDPLLRPLRTLLRKSGGELLEGAKESCLICPPGVLPRFLKELRRSKYPFSVQVSNQIERLGSSSRRQDWHCGSWRLPLWKRVLVMGILNVTPDSFSDGGSFFLAERAMRRAHEIQDHGADILDIGGESSRPGSEPVSEEEETRRILPVIERLSREMTIPISVDTTKAAVARRAIDAGASIINDISALRFDLRMSELVRQSEAGVILMHMKGVPKSMQRRPSYRSVIGEIFRFLVLQREKAIEAGIRENQIIFDPGIGFGKSGRHNLEILHRLPELLCLGRPLLVGPSRKGFISQILDLPPSERLEGTAAAVSAAVLGGARIIRVHDVNPMSRVVRVAEAIARERTKAP